MERRESITRRKQDAGQAMVEYSIILALVSITALAVLKVIGVEVAGLLTSVHNAFGGA
jgi:Flp pilus assembly pilin Flp